MPGLVWIDLFFATYSIGGNGELLFNEWPDGGTYFEQSNVQIQLFKYIESEYFMRVKQKSKGARRGK